MHSEPRKWPNGLDVVLKVAERCNLACPYCYYFYQENDLHKGGPALISESVVRETAAFLRQGVRDLDIHNLYIGLHGGEPLLQPKKRLAAICKILREELSDVTKVHLGMQTNGTRIDPEWIDLFSEHGVMVGVSIDGPPHVHNTSRPDHKGRGSYDATVRGLRMLQEASRKGRMPHTGVLCVANPSYSGEEIVRHFVEDLQVSNFNLLLPREGHDSDIWKPQSKWIHYFNEVLQTWQKLTTPERPVSIYFLSEILAAMLNEPLTQRLDYRRANRHNIISITSEGKLGPDDNIMALDKAIYRSDVTIRNTSLMEFMASPQWQELVRSVDTPPEKCASCEWLRTCRSGDLFNRYQKNAGFNQPSVFCETLDSIHTSLASLVARREDGMERLTRALGGTPQFRARDFLQPRPAGAGAPPETWRSEGVAAELPVGK